MRIAGIFLLVTSWMILPAQITVDGLFNDWTSDTVQISDPTGDAANLDFTKLIVSSDADDLFVRVETDAFFGLQENNELTLYIDTDDNPNTGQSINGIGADLEWELGQRKGYFNGQELGHAEVGLVTAPTVTSNIFELQFSRSLGNLFSSDKVKVVLADESSSGDMVPDNGALEHQFRNIDYGYSPIPLEREDSSFLRVMNYNVLFNGITEPDRVDRFARIFNSLKPDIIAFNELFDTEAPEVKQFLDQQVPISNSNGWYVEKVDYGNVTASRYPIANTWEVYPGRRISAFLVDLPDRFPEDILVINAHLKCCNADKTRQDEVDAIAAFYQDIKTAGGKIDLPQGTPFILLGDMNLVGDQQQLRTLITGDIVDEQKYGADVDPDWDNSDLIDLRSYHADEREAYTWWDPSSSFYPGRLDFMFFSESVLKVEKHFILRTESMSSKRLQEYDLEQDDTRNASDHLPKVADFTFKNFSGERSLKPGKTPFQVYPNPTGKEIIIKWDTEKDNASCTLLNTAGNVLYNDIIASGINQIDLSPYPAGIYTFVIHTGESTYSQKILKTNSSN